MKTITILKVTMMITTIFDHECTTDIAKITEATVSLGGGGRSHETY